MRIYWYLGFRLFPAYPNTTGLRWQGLNASLELRARTLDELKALVREMRALGFAS